MTQPTPSQQCSSDLAAALAEVAGEDFELVEQQFQVSLTGVGATKQLEVSTKYRHTACDVYMKVHTLSAAGAAGAPSTFLFAKFGANQEIVSTGRYQWPGTDSSFEAQDVAVLQVGPSRRVATARGRPADQFRFVATIAPIAGVAVTANVTITVVGWGRGPTSERDGTWWSSQNTQNASAPGVLLNWDSPVTVPCKMASFVAFDARSAATGGTDFLMFFDQVQPFQTPGNAPGNGDVPIEGGTFPLPARPSSLIVDFSGRDRRFFQGITWALSTTGDFLTLDTSGATARVDIETG